MSEAKTNINDIFNNGQDKPRKVTEPEQSYTEMFRRSILDQTKDYPEPESLLKFHQNGNVYPHRTKKSISLQQGKQKSKKTTELAMEVGAYITPTPKPDNIWFECAEPGTVLFFDNEQGESYAARTMKLTLKLAGLETSEKLIYCDLREFGPKDRLGIIKAGIKATPGVKWVIVDGIVDIMNDFMSAEEGHLIITDLSRLSSEYNIHVTGVLHQNKGQSKDARAHVGSIASQKCELEIMTERDPEDKALSIVSAKESRDLPFEDFAIRWDRGCLPCIVQDWQPQTTSKKEKIEVSNLSEEDSWQILKEVFSQGDKFSYGKLTLQIKLAFNKQTGKSIGDNKAKEIVTYFKNNGWLKQEEPKAPYQIGEFENPARFNGLNRFN